MTTASALPDSGDPGNLFEPLKLDQHKPELLSEATWKHLYERYQFLAKLGQGGQAVIFHMKERTNSCRDVAIKVYHANAAAALKAFDNEARWLASSSLPEDVVVDLYDANPPPSVQPYLVLKLIEKAKEIHEYAESPRPMKMPERIDLYEKFLRTLHRFHDCGIVIGDVSARNVLVQSGDRIWFIDLAGAKSLHRGRTASQSSLNMATPGNVPTGVLDGEMSTSRVTDLFGAANVGVQILTGRSWRDLLVDAGLCDGKGEGDQSHPQALAICEQELVRRDVPPAVRRIILKGLRLPDERLKPDPEVYATALRMADDIEAWRVDCRRREELAIRQVEFDSWRRHRNAIIAIATVLILLIGGIGGVGWRSYWDARNATADAAELRLWQSLQAEVRSLPNVTHPAVASLLEGEKQLIAQRDDLVARNNPLGARQALGELLAKTRDILRTAREVERAGRLREAIGRVLLEDEATERSGFWVATAPMIGARLDELRRRYVTLAGQIQTGQIDSLPESLAQLQTDLGELFKVNIEARSAFEALVGYQRAKAQVPKRLRETDGFQTIDSGAQIAQKSWDITAWDGGRSLALARSQFGIAQQQLTEWLPKNLNPEELAALERDSQARVAELETERQKLLADIERLTGNIRTLKEQFTTLTQERLEDRQRLKDTTTEFVTANATVAAQKKAIEDESLKLTQALERMKGLEADSRALVAVREELQKLKPKLMSAEAEAAKWKTEADTAQKLVAGLRKSIEDAAKNSGTKAGDRRVLKIKGVDFAFRWCPAGSFKMGSPSSEPYRGTNETQHNVTLTQGFWMLETEFTQEMWFAVMGTRLWQRQSFVKEGANYPATYVSWNDAILCCQNLTMEAQNAGVLAARESITLPTEAQWEYACRAGTSTAYSFGDDYKKLGEYAWFDKNAGDIYQSYAHGVGMKKPNPWGLSDMHGNVYEFCQDWYGDYDKAVTIDPDGPTTGKNRVLRGGSLNGGSGHARSAQRYGDAPDNRGFHFFIGFRVVCVGARTQPARDTPKSSPAGPAPPSLTPPGGR